MINIKRMFKDTFKGQVNIMTPDVVRYGKKGPYLFELSKGIGIMGSPMYGVTVLDVNGNHLSSLGRCFASESQAELYIKSLK